MIAQLILFVSEKYVLIVNPGVVYFGSNISVILTCTITDANNEIQRWRDDELLYTIMRDDNKHSCTGFEAIKTTFDLECDPDNRQFMLIIPPNEVSYGIGDTKCCHFKNISFNVLFVRSKCFFTKQDLFMFKARYRYVG